MCHYGDCLIRVFFCINNWFLFINEHLNHVRERLGRGGSGIFSERNRAVANLWGTSRPVGVLWDLCSLTFL